MAISKMEKATLISAKGNDTKLLQAIQELQNMEVVNSLTDLSEEERLLLGSLESGQNQASNEVIDKLEEQLADVRNSIAFLISYAVGKADVIFAENQTLSEFEANQNKQQIITLVKEIKQLRERQNQLAKEKQHYLQAESDLSKWQYLEVNPQELEDSAYVTSVMGNFSVSVKDKLLTSLAEIEPVVIEIPYENTSKVYMYLIYLNEAAELIEPLLTKHSVHRENYQYTVPPKEAYQAIQKKLADLVEAEEVLRKEVKTHKASLLTLQKAEELLLAKLQQEEAKSQLGVYHDLLILRGWIESERKPQFSQIIENFSSVTNPIILTYQEAQEDQDVPTLLKNNKLVTPFESLTEMYSLPKYHELDPTPFLTPFYMVFFGMMVADVGYGLLMLIGTILGKHFLTLRKSTVGFLDFFQILAIPVMLWGLIYGSFFGAALPFHLLSTTEDMNTILLLSVVFGFIQLLVGLLIGGVQRVKQKQYLESISDGFAWQGILIAVAMLVVSQLVFKNTILFNAAIVLFCASAVLIIVIPMFTSGSKGKGLAKGLYAFYGITGYIGDLVSYTRLMALGISGGSIAAAFNLLVSFLPPIARFTVGLVLIVLLHALNIFLSLLGAYVHGARLQYVEFFGKFFEGGGRKFSPLKPQEKYMDFKVNKEQIEKKDILGGN